jgi:hypothetical protein
MKEIYTLLSFFVPAFLLASLSNNSSSIWHPEPEAIEALTGKHLFLPVRY